MAAELMAVMGLVGINCSIADGECSIYEYGTSK